MSVIFLFIDGVGLGPSGPDNPLTQEEWQGFLHLSGGQPFDEGVQPLKAADRHFFTAVDATLGIAGLPQSGTGQATLFSGQNGADRIGKHFGPFPHSGVKPLLRQQSIFHKAQEKGKSCSFINAYPDIFFKKARERNRWSCTTLMTRSAGLPLNTTKEVREQKAVTAGLTQQAWREQLDIEVPVITPEAAAHRLLERTAGVDLLLHEYYLTDKAGHSQQHGKAREVLGRYDRFLTTLIRERPSSCTLVLCSDHGNIEDLSTKTHTFNKVPLYAEGPGAGALEGAESIMDVTPAIIGML